MGNSCCCSSSGESEKVDANCQSRARQSVCSECQQQRDTDSTASHSVVSHVSGGPLSSSVESQRQLQVRPQVVNPLSSSRNVENMACGLAASVAPPSCGEGGGSRVTTRTDELQEEGSEEYFASLDDDGQMAHLRLGTAVGDALFAAAPDDVNSSSSGGVPPENESPPANEHCSAPLSRWSRNGSNLGSRPESSQGVRSCSRVDVGIEFGSSFFDED